MRLVALSPMTGKVTKVFGTRILRYHNATTLTAADYYFQVFGLDPTGKHALVAAHHFGVLTDGRFTRLPGGPGEIQSAGW